MPAMIGSMWSLLIAVAVAAAPGGAATAGAGHDVIAYSHGSGIATVDPASGARRTLTTHRGWSDSEPDWSPDGRRIAFERSTDGRRSIHIYVMRADGSRARRITGGRFDERPAWSPRGDWIAYQSDAGIRLVRPDGSRNHRLRGSARDDSRPAWEPDGKRLSYTAGSEMSTRVMIAGIDGRNRHRLAAGWSSDWSPSGAKIAITGPDGGVFVVAAGGGRPKSLGKGYEPVWSRDGKRLAFTRWPDNSNTRELWVMHADGSARRRLVRGAETPAWG